MTHVGSKERRLTTIHLGGKLGKLFGETWRLAVTSPADAIRAIDINLKGKLMAYLVRAGHQKYYKVSLKDRGNLLDGSELGHRSGNSDIYIWPTVRNRSSGAAKLIAGIVILAIVTIVTLGVGGAASGAFYTAGTAATVGGAAATAGSLTLLGTVAVGLATSLILGGIAQLLAPNPNDNNGGGLGSNVFQGTIEGGAQGGCVPIVYGTALVSAPLPISLWFENVDWSTTQNAYVGATTIADLPGGGHEVILSPIGGGTSSIIDNNLE